MRKRLVAAVLILCIVVGACERDGPSVGDGFEVLDRNGVQVALNRAGLDVPTIQLENPVLRLGSEEGSRPDFFGQINSVHFDPNGNLWIVDASSGELRVFSAPSGEHLFTVGGRGQGPGEFSLPLPIGFDETQAWVWDQQPGRLTVFSLEGELEDVRTVTTSQGVVPRILHRTEHGRFVARLPEVVSAPVSDGMILQDTVRIWEFEAFDRDPELMGEREGPTWIYASGIQAPVPFTGDSRFDMSEDRLVFTDPKGAPRLDVTERGELRHQIEIERERTPVSQELIELVLSGPTVSQPAAELLRARVRELPLPDFLPTWEWVRVDSGGGVFALHHGTLLSEEIWDVFDSEGRLFSRISLPANAHLMEVEEQWLVVVEMPEDSGPRVEVYSRPRL